MAKSRKLLLSPSETPWRGQEQVHLPLRKASAVQELLRRVGIGVVLLLIITLVVYVDHESYVDLTAHDGVSFLDAFYYATVTMTTTGYGDIVPVSPHARLINALIVTPIRVAFLALLVGTTVEVLANEGRRALMDAQWRKTLRQHTIVIGYGTMGQSAVSTLIGNGVPPEKIVVIDRNPHAVTAANRQNLAAFEGDATSRELLHRAELPKAREVIITINSDDTTILVTLTVRQLNRGAHLVAAVRDVENKPLLIQSGANAIVTSSDAVGRLMGLSAISPYLGTVIEDMLTPRTGLDIVQRMITKQEDGIRTSEVQGERVLAVIRNQTLRRFYEVGSDVLQLGDEIIVVRGVHEPQRGKSGLDRPRS
ncbi:MAG: potassium channel family protein [Propionibacteriaceae bacterium]|jgi:voltage-gated potassium channel|nr:potassium channel family protein [Propionibacteriaceae bacterium]